MGVKGECCAAAGEGVGWVWEGGELGPREVVAIHWEGCGDWCFGGRVFGGVEVVYALGHCAGEFGFAGAWDTAYGYHKAGVGGGGTVFC